MQILQVELLAFQVARDMGITDDVMIHYGIKIPISANQQEGGLTLTAPGPLGEAKEELTVDKDGNKSVTVSRWLVKYNRRLILETVYKLLK